MLIARAPILAVALLLLARDAYGVKRVTVDAAEREDGDFIMMYADGEYLMMSDNFESETGSISELRYPETFPFTAMATVYDQGDYFIYGPDFYYSFLRTTTKEYYTQEEEKFFQNGGPDAVSGCNNEMFFFKGCLVAKQKRWSSASDVRDYGLPCSPDAAWKTSYGDGMVVLKGDQIWFWDCRGRVSQKRAFSSVYHIRTWELIPTPE